MSYSIDPQCMVFARIKACKTMRLKRFSIRGLFRSGSSSSRLRSAFAIDHAVGRLCICLPGDQLLGCDRTHVFHPLKSLAHDAAAPARGTPYAARAGIRAPTFLNSLVTMAPSSIVAFSHTMEPPLSLAFL